jgi:hypothetical protein
MLEDSLLVALTMSDSDSDDDNNNSSIVKAKP